MLLNDAAIAVQPEQLSLDLLRVLSFSLLIYSEGGLALSIYTSTIIDGVLICGNGVLGSRAHCGPICINDGL